MANRVKEVSAFNGTSWGAAVPLGANDANIDITSSTSQPDGSAVSGVTGDSATALDTAAVAVASGDTGASAWTKFNRFRKRVASNFANYIQGSIATSYNATGSDSAVYSTNVLNNYMANVIGYSGTTAPEAGSVADQLSSLNDNRIQYSDVYFEHGTYVYNTVPAFAVVTGGNKRVTLYLPLGKQVNPSDTVTIDAVKLSGLRKPSGGYIDDSGSDRKSLIANSDFKNPNTAFLYINFTRNTNWDSTNNIPLTGTVDITFTIS